MKKLPLLKMFLIGPALLWVAGCQHRSPNAWDDHPNEAHQHSKKHSSSLWESSDDATQDNALSLSSEEFIPLNEDDLKNQFADDASPVSSLGEGGVPSADEFSDPQGELASIFKPVFFNTDDYTLKSKEHLETIHRVIAYLKTHPTVAVIVEGHCDERGPGAYNMALGAKRANYVRSLLVKEGVDVRQVHTISCGKEMPFKEGHDPEAWSQNRRGHFRIYKK